MMASCFSPKTNRNIPTLNFLQGTMFYIRQIFIGPSHISTWTVNSLKTEPCLKLLVFEWPTRASIRLVSWQIVN